MENNDENTSLQTRYFIITRTKRYSIINIKTIKEIDDETDE